MINVKLMLRLFVTATAAVALLVPLTAASGASPGTLYVTKECSAYNGQADAFCTITSSNLSTIEAGSQVIYLSAAGDPAAGFLISDIRIYSGESIARGQVRLNLSKLTGAVTLSGGTGVFAHFHATVKVVCDWPTDYPNCSWVGPYSFNPPN